jgi:uncharacterized protein
MRSLHELQRVFGTAVVEPQQAAAAASLFRGSAEMVLARLAVYRSNVYGNCANALKGAYPIVRKIVGEEFFDAMARAYARAEPSTNGDLNAFGERLADFVAGFEHTKDLPYLPDVACMEWAAHRAYYAPNAEPLDMPRLEGIPEARFASLRLRLAPACTLIESRWPLARIWEVHQDDYRGAIDVDLHAGPNRILVHRPRWRAEVCALTPGDYGFLWRARQGHMLGEALDTALGLDRNFEPASALARWVIAGVIVDLEIG